MHVLLHRKGKWHSFLGLSHNFGWVLMTWLCKWAFVLRHCSPRLPNIRQQPQRGFPMPSKQEGGRGASGSRGA